MHDKHTEVDVTKATTTDFATDTVLVSHAEILEYLQSAMVFHHLTCVMCRQTCAPPCSEDGLTMVVMIAVRYR